MATVIYKDTAGSATGASIWGITLVVTGLTRAVGAGRETKAASGLIGFDSVSKRRTQRPLVDRKASIKIGQTLHANDNDGIVRLNKGKGFARSTGLRLAA